MLLAVVHRTRMQLESDSDSDHGHQNPDRQSGIQNPVCRIQYPESGIIFFPLFTDRRSDRWMFALLERNIDDPIVWIRTGIRTSPLISAGVPSGYSGNGEEDEESVTTACALWSGLRPCDAAPAVRLTTGGD